MKALISQQDIENIRPIAENIPANMVDFAITEAQTVDFAQYMGCDNSFMYYLSENQSVARVQKLLNGGTYVVDGKTRYFTGLITALSYFAYARILTTANVRLTAAGVVSKNKDQSTTLGGSEITQAASQAIGVGKEYLKQIKDYLCNEDDVWNDLDLGLNTTVTGRVVAKTLRKV